MKIPTEPGPGSSLQSWCREVCNCLRQLQPVGGDGVIVNYGTNGCKISLTPQSELPVLALIADCLAEAKAYTDDQVATEEDRAEAAEAGLSAAIAAEVARAIAAEAVLEGEIDDEVTRATAAEAALEVEIAAGAAAIVVLQGQVTALEAMAADYAAMLTQFWYPSTGTGEQMGVQLNNLIYEADFDTNQWGDLGTEIYNINGMLGGQDGAVIQAWVTDGQTAYDQGFIDEEGNQCDAYMLPGGAGEGSSLVSNVTVYDDSCDSSVLQVISPAS